MNARPAPSLLHDHGELCWARAFPKSLVEYREAVDALQLVDQRVRSLSKAQRRDLEDTGVAGTLLRYSFSFDVARWLARTSPGAVVIDWDEFEDADRLDEMLRLLLQPVEDEYFESGAVTTREWVTLASSGFAGTDFDWLMAQLCRQQPAPVWRQLYDAADIPLAWDLAASKFSKSSNVYPVATVSLREAGMRSRPYHVKSEIQRPVKSVASLSKTNGARMIDVAMASLASRHRETYHFNFANPQEVYLANVGRGVSIAVFGLLPSHRFPLECTMGFLILANGVPIGYGGSSIVFKQLNTGVNIFDEYRGSEASFLWVQVMRVYHTLVGCRRYVANPYQFGEGNREALRSGAFWFYYKLGYRPISSEIRALARAEVEKKKMNRRYSTGMRTLGRLASCDMHLTLPGARRSEFFDERWIATSSQLATGELARAGGKSRRAAATHVMNSVAKHVGIRTLDSWSADEKRCFRSLAPIVAAADPGEWRVDTKRLLRKLLRAKGGKRELNYARHLFTCDQFLEALQRTCREAGRGS